MFNKKIAVGIASLALVAGAAAPAAFAWPQSTSPSFDSSDYSVDQGGDRVGVQLDDVKQNCRVTFTLGGHSWTARADNANEAYAVVKAPALAGEYTIRGVVSNSCTADAGDRNWVYFYVGDSVVVDDAPSWVRTAGKGIRIDGSVVYSDGGAPISGAVNVKVYDGSKLLGNVATDWSGDFTLNLKGSDIPGYNKIGNDNAPVLKYVVVANKNYYSEVPPFRAALDSGNEG